MEKCLRIVTRNTSLSPSNTSPCSSNVCFTVWVCCCFTPGRHTTLQNQQLNQLSLLSGHTVGRNTSPMVGVGWGGVWEVGTRHHPPAMHDQCLSPLLNNATQCHHSPIVGTQLRSLTWVPIGREFQGHSLGWLATHIQVLHGQ